jgi:hypothetical protein
VVWRHCSFKSLSYSHVILHARLYRSLSMQNCDFLFIWSILGLHDMLFSCSDILIFIFFPSIFCLDLCDIIRIHVDVWSLNMSTTLTSKYSTLRYLIMISDTIFLNYWKHESEPRKCSYILLMWSCSWFSYFIFCFFFMIYLFDFEDLCNQCKIKFYYFSCRSLTLEILWIPLGW